MLRGIPPRSLIHYTFGKDIIQLSLYKRYKFYATYLVVDSKFFCAWILFETAIGLLLPKVWFDRLQPFTSKTFSPLHWCLRLLFVF